MDRSGTDKRAMYEHAPHVVIVGAGFGGLAAARALRKAPLRVTVLDRANHHLFQPLLYQVATAVLNPADIAEPIRRILRGTNIDVLMAEVRGIDTVRKKVICEDTEIAYDHLIVASGATHSYFGHEEWAQYAPGLKSIDDALEIRRRLLLAFERAEREADPARRMALTTFVVVGGGPTGVELAGALADITRHTLPGEYHNVDPCKARVILLEAVPRLLTAWSENLSVEARLALERRGVEVRTNCMVTAIDAEGVTYARIGPSGDREEEERILSYMVLWGAGVKASPLGKDLSSHTDKVGRVRVTPVLNVPGVPDVYVIGDLASVESEGTPVPGLAPAAMQMGKHAAKNILRKLRGEPLLPFRYKDRGAFAIVGRGAGVGTLYQRLELKGFPAWLIWLSVHLFFLIGFRNKVEVMLGWMYYFFTRKRPNRLITGVYGIDERLSDQDGGRHAPYPPNQPRVTWH